MKYSNEEDNQLTWRDDIISKPTTLHRRAFNRDGVQVGAVIQGDHSRFYQAYIGNKSIYAETQGAAEKYVEDNFLQVQFQETFRLFTRDSDAHPKIARRSQVKSEEL